MRWRQLRAFTTIAFVSALVALIPVPWVIIATSTPTTLTGLDLTLGGYTMPPTSNYVWALALLAIFGAALPYLLRRYRTLTQVYLSLAGVICVILMQLHLPAGYPEIHWGPGYYAAACAFFVAALISMYTLGRIQR